jgi:FkbM family methyltransferase
VSYREFLKRTPAAPVVKAVRRRWSRRPTRVELGGFLVKIPHRDVPRYAEGFEPLTLEWVKRILQPGMTAVDVGAAIGLFSLNLARLVSPGGTVVAIEPAPANLRLLRWNAARNAARIEVVPAAASSESGMRHFLLTESSDSHAFFHHPLIAPSKEIEVRVVRLDSVVEKADFFKIDVEGAELEVLAGAGQLLERRPPLVVEWVPACQVAAGHSVDDLPTTLADAGYPSEVFDELNKSPTTVGEVLASYGRGELPAHWYANLCCLPA